MTRKRMQISTRAAAAAAAAAVAPEEDVSEHTTAQVPIFTPVNAPRITSLAHADLVKWKRDREEYEDQVRSRVKATGEDEEAVLVSVKDSFDRRLLKTACRLRFKTDY